MPIITHFPLGALRRFGYELYNAAWDLSQEKVVITTYLSTEKLKDAMEKLFTPGGFDGLLAWQKQCYPRPPEKGVAEKVIADTLENVVKK